MKNATPSDIAIKNVLKDIDELISYAKDFIKVGHNDAPVFLAECGPLERRFDKVLNALEQARVLGYITQEQFTQIKKYFYIMDDNASQSLENVSTNYLNTNKGGHIADIVERIFPQTENNLFIERMSEMKKLLEKSLSKEEKVKGLIKGLKQPIRWEEVILLFDGANIDVIQDDRNLGKYSLDDLNFPKLRTNKQDKILRGVKGIFMSLFFNKTDKSISVIDSKDNNNQKLKSSLSKILCEAFGTNKDPIEITDGVYRPVFIARFGGELRINEHRSGGELFDNKEY
jgi:hypothetical protein